MSHVTCHVISYGDYKTKVEVSDNYTPVFTNSLNSTQNTLFFFIYLKLCDGLTKTYWLQKIPDTGDRESFNQCGEKHKQTKKL